MGKSSQLPSNFYCLGFWLTPTDKYKRFGVHNNNSCAENINVFNCPSAFSLRLPPRSLAGCFCTRWWVAFNFCYEEQKYWIKLLMVGMRFYLIFSSWLHFFPAPSKRWSANVLLLLSLCWENYFVMWSMVKLIINSEQLQVKRFLTRRYFITSVSLSQKIQLTETWVW